MNQRLLSVFIFALVIAGIASFVVYRVIAGHVFTAVPVVTTRLVVANKDLEVGAMIREDDIRRADRSGDVPEQAVLKPEDALSRGVTTKIFKDEIVLSTRLAAKGAGAGLAATIPVGMRAVALRVNDVVGLAGFVLPGMHVDVLVAGNAPGMDQNRVGTISRTVLQNLEVLSANQKIERNTDGKPEDAQVVNLLVTPDQAEILNLAGGESKVQLVLRNPLDTKEEVTHGSTSAAMYGYAPAGLPQKAAVIYSPRPKSPPLPLKARVEAQTVEVFSGVKRSEQRFESRPEEQ